MNRSADEILDESFLQVRAKLLEIAATLDRIDRAGQPHTELSVAQQNQRQKLDDALRICLGDSPDRAAQIQQLFSRRYEDSWRKTMQL